MTEDIAASDGIADAVGRLSEDTRLLVRRELDAARREMWDRAKQDAPGMALVGGAVVMSVFAAASGYRLTLRLLDKALPRESAPLVATLAFGAAAGASASLGLRRLQGAPVPFPADTAAATRQAVADHVPPNGARSRRG